ncbi:hypothetical protein MAPG_06413 [Magnaporthiopsis poae ATCC 64411]|uniref:Uncharacterized protein n=1 Tax=Magnaporthiopsis poae (strain ATCC 64411 / 73-15) TaxID=644358 RepID=A0A0C4E1Y8_MAGP6|nr:hypothetical protein MAPG_06413 [Magnaporthiopsis poae ATCC 64411]
MHPEERLSRGPSAEGPSRYQVPLGVRPSPISALSKKSGALIGWQDRKSGSRAGVETLFGARATRYLGTRFGAADGCVRCVLGVNRFAAVLVLLMHENQDDRSPLPCRITTDADDAVPAGHLLSTVSGAC